MNLEQGIILEEHSISPVLRNCWFLVMALQIMSVQKFPQFLENEGQQTEKDGGSRNAPWEASCVPRGEQSQSDWHLAGNQSSGFLWGRFFLQKF